MNVEEAQRLLCKKYAADFQPVVSGMKVGVALNIKDKLVPINGLRHTPSGGASGWYIWAGEILSQEPDFFKPLHIEHLKDWEPSIDKFLALPPGWRFLKAGDYEDVWFDASLL